MPLEERICPIVASTSGPKAHFFGYYEKPPWNASGSCFLAVEAAEEDRLPVPGEKAVVGIYVLAERRFHPLAETGAWNWQQGSMLQWMPSAPDREIVFNDCRDGEVFAVVMDVHSGKKRELSRPVYNVAPDGKWAVSTNFGRLAATRSLVGYASAVDRGANDLQPKDDGIWRMDLATGQSRLVVSFDSVAQLNRNATMENVKHRFEHIFINTDGTRLFFLHRWKREGGGRPFYDRLYTVNPDGSDLFLLAGDNLISHFDWRDPSHLLAWAEVEGAGRHFFLFRDRTREYEVVGADVLTRDGHCSYSPDRRWILGDTYPDADLVSRVWLYEVATNRRVEIGRFTVREILRKVSTIRCDLHPRWSRDGRQVCIDSAHEGPRQMYVLDVSGITSASGGRG